MDVKPKAEHGVMNLLLRVRSLCMIIFTISTQLPLWSPLTASQCQEETRSKFWSVWKKLTDVVIMCLICELLQWCKRKTIRWKKHTFCTAEGVSFCLYVNSVRSTQWPWFDLIHWVIYTCSVPQEHHRRPHSLSPSSLKYLTLCLSRRSSHHQIEP